MTRTSPGLARVLAAIATLALATSVAAAQNKKSRLKPTPSPTPAPELIEVTGSILGVSLFGPLERAREEMKRFKLENEAAAESAEKEERGEAGKRMIWRLAETEYLWVVAWADKEGKVVKISASVRPDKKKPFREIGDLARAKVHNDSMAMWVVQHPDGIYYRVVAKGPAGQASSIYMYSLKPEAID